MLHSALQTLLLAAALAAELGYLAPETVDKMMRAQLPEKARSAIAKRLPGARVLATCDGSFTVAGAAEVAITLLDGPVTPGGEPPKVLRVVLLADGSLVILLPGAKPLEA